MAVDVLQTMEMAQTTQTVKWLDEERRKDKALIAALQEQLQTQAQISSQQVAQLQGLQAALAGVQSGLSRVTEFEQMVTQHKAEIINQLDLRDQARRKEQAEAERLRRIEYESVMDHLHRLDRELQVLPRYDLDINARRAEEQRLSEGLQRTVEQLSDLSRRTEERFQIVPYLEEQRRVDNRRIVELEQDIPEVVKRIETVARRMPLIEERVQKMEPRINEAAQEVKKYDKPIEELRVSDFQREQKMKRYLDQGEMVAKELERVRAETQGFFEQQQEVKRLLKMLGPFQARLEKRQNEVTEMQRLAEERLRRQWEEWQEEQAKQETKRDLVTEERWRRQDGFNDEQTKRLRAIPPVLQLHQERLEALWEVRRADATQFLATAQNLYDAILAPIDGQLAILRGEQKKES